MNNIKKLLQNVIHIKIIERSSTRIRFTIMSKKLKIANGAVIA